MVWHHLFKKKIKGISEFRNKGVCVLCGGHLIGDLTFSILYVLNLVVEVRVWPTPLTV